MRRTCYTKQFINDTIGDGIFACEKIVKCTNVMKTDHFISFIDKSSTKSYCNSCYSESDNLKRCSVCKHVRYCSEKCQKKNWKIHKYECPNLKELTDVEFIPLLIRLTALLHSSPELRNAYGLNDMMKHTEMENQKISEYYMLLINGVKEIVKAENVDPSLCFNIYSKLIVNLFTLEDGQLRSIGCALIPSFTKLNHSCSPNCVLSFKGGTAYITAIKDIPKGAQLTISYISLPQSFLQRKAELHQQFNFKCECDMCTLQRKQGVDTMLMRQCSSCKEHCHPTVYEEKQELYCTVCKSPFTSSPILSDVALKNMERYDLNMTAVSHQDVVVVNHLVEQTEKLIVEGAWEPALRTGLKATVGLMEWAQDFPSTGLFIAKLAKLYGLQQGESRSSSKDNLMKALQLLDIALRCLSAALPRKHDLLCEVKQLYDSTLQELAVLQK